MIATNPFKNPPPYEQLPGNLSGYYSRRINIQHRLVYEVYNEPVTENDKDKWTMCLECAIMQNSTKF